MATRKPVKKSARSRGRPSSFKPEFQQVARKLCLMGATDKDLAEAFGVTEQTINNWKGAHPEFFESLKAAKSELDDKVEASLFQRAVGYEHKATKIALTAEGESHSVEYIERYPPDTTAMIFWLKNRRPDQWREKSDVIVTHSLADLIAEGLPK